MIGFTSPYNRNKHIKSSEIIVAPFNKNSTLKFGGWVYLPP